MTATTLPRRLGRGAALACLLATAACADHNGPVVGDWRGHDSPQSLEQRVLVEIILDGPPGAQSGTYHYISLTQDTDFDTGGRRVDWTDHWSAQPYVVNGQQMRHVHLDHLAGPHIADFILTRDNILVPLPNPLHPDLSRAALGVSLYPVPRGTFGYGRA